MASDSEARHHWSRDSLIAWVARLDGYVSDGLILRAVKSERVHEDLAKLVQVARGMLECEPETVDILQGYGRTGAPDADRERKAKAHEDVKSVFRRLAGK